MNLRTAAQQALDEWHTDPGSVRMASLMMALRTALAEPEQEPLTEEEIIYYFEHEVDTGSLLSFADGVRYAERAHGIGGEA
jgi:hypothetical protein